MPSGRARARHHQPLRAAPRPWAWALAGVVALAGAADRARATAAAPEALLLERLAARHFGDTMLQWVLATRAALDSVTRNSRRAAPRWERVAALAARRGDTDAELFAHYAATDAMLQVGDYAAVAASARRLIERAATSAAPGWVAWGESALGVVARRRGELNQALEHYKLAHAAALRAGSERTRAQVLINLGTVHRDMGRYSEALEAQMQALELRLAAPQRERLDVPYRNLGLLYRDIEDHVAARQYLELAIDAAGREADPTALSSALGSFATVLNDVGEHGRALAAAERALAIDTPLGLRYPIALEHIEAARALAGLGRSAEASVHVDAALKLGQALGQPDVIGDALLLRGAIEAAAGRVAATEASYAMSLEHLSRAGLKTKQHAAYGAIERLLEQRGAMADALRYARQRATLREELLGLAAARRLAILELKHERERSERRSAMLRMDSELERLNLEADVLRQRIGLGAIAVLAALVLLVAWRWREASRTASALGARNAAISAQQVQLRDANRQLEAQAERLYAAAISDPLTGIWNRGHLIAELTRHFDEAIARQQPLSLLLLDLDGFKPINDSYGHPFGDRVLVEVAKRLRETLRGGELLGRYGGEEFLVGLPGLASEDALAVAERMRRAIELGFRAIDGRNIGLTASVGIASTDGIDRPALLELIARADAALYRAKREGRNRSCAAQTP